MIFRVKIDKYGLILRMSWHQLHYKRRGSYNTSCRNREIRINVPISESFCLYKFYFTPKISSLSKPNITEDFVCTW